MKIILNLSLKNDFFNLIKSVIGQDYIFKKFESSTEVLKFIHTIKPALILVDAPKADSFFLKIDPSITDCIPIVIYGEECHEKKVKIMAEEYDLDMLLLPIEPFIVKKRIENWIVLAIVQKEAFEMSNGLDHVERFGSIYTMNDDLTHSLQMAQLLSKKKEPVFILGEYGTEKEELARIIHHYSSRSAMEFQSWDCYVGSDLELLQLFFEENIGLTMNPNIGTVYLDNIQYLSKENQIWMYWCLNNIKSMKSNDVQFIVSSSTLLNKDVHNGHFNESLFCLLTKYILHIPPLRNRTSDIPFMVRKYILNNKNHRKVIHNVAPEFLEILQKHDWKGNVDELHSILEFAITSCDSHTLQKKHLPRNLIVVDESIQTFKTLQEHESEYIMKVMDSVKGDINRATRILDLKREELDTKMKLHSIKRY